MFHLPLTWFLSTLNKLVSEYMIQIFLVWYFRLNPTHMLYEYDPHKEENIAYFTLTLSLIYTLA
jgi:hypothetical protein